jgi:hypothetical protein
MPGIWVYELGDDLRSVAANPFPSLVSNQLRRGDPEIAINDMQSETAGA